MTHRSLYDEDILLWSEEQAENIRRLGRKRGDLPNDIDVENVAEEIESVGRSELAAVESQIHNVFVHLIKLALEPDADSARHWKSEIAGFHAELNRRYTPSMRERVNLDRVWRSAKRQVLLDLPEELAAAAILPDSSPVGFDMLLAEEFHTAGAVNLLARPV
ncbi:MAG TPA: DUF29 domain-containing protein [Bauldia sp.]|nr:DUF29 domain-containing protein [Bauldia sp.]